MIMVARAKLQSAPPTATPLIRVQGKSIIEATQLAAERSSGFLVKTGPNGRRLIAQYVFLTGPGFGSFEL